MAKIDLDAEIYSVRHKVQTVKPTTTGAGYSHVFVKADGLYLVDENDVEYGPFGPISRVLIEELTPAGPTATFTSIPQTYTHLFVDYMIRSGSEFETSSVTLFINGDTVTANYRRTQHYANGGHSVNESDDAAIAEVSGNTAFSNSAGHGSVYIYYYTNTTFNKIAQCRGVHRRAAADLSVCSYGMDWENTEAIYQLELGITGGGNMIAGSTLRLYGIV